MNPVPERALCQFRQHENIEFGELEKRPEVRMNMFFLAMACFLLLTMLVGLVRVFRGPGAEDRLAAMQLFGTTGVAVLLLLAAAFDSSALRNTALVFALLTVLAVVAFVRVPGREDRHRNHEEGP